MSNVDLYYIVVRNILDVYFFVSSFFLLLNINIAINRISKAPLDDTFLNPPPACLLHVIAYLRSRFRFPAMTLEVPPHDSGLVDAWFLLPGGGETRRKRQAEIDTIKAEIDTIKAKIDTTKAEIDTIKAEIDTIKAKIDTTKAEIDTIKAEIDTIKAEIYTINNHMNTY